MKTPNWLPDGWSGSEREDELGLLRCWRPEDDRDLVLLQWTGPRPHLVLHRTVEPWTLSLTLSPAPTRAQVEAAIDAIEGVPLPPFPGAQA